VTAQIAVLNRSAFAFRTRKMGTRKNRMPQFPDHYSLQQSVDIDVVDARRVAAEHLEAFLFGHLGDCFCQIIKPVGIKAGRVRKVSLEHDVVFTNFADRLNNPVPLKEHAGADIAAERSSRLGL